MSALFITRGATRPLVILCLCVLAIHLVKAQPLVWQDRQTFREAKVNTPVGQGAGFSLLSAKATGVQFTNTLARVRMMNANLLNGAGVASGDVDGDGLCDIYVCSLDGENGLFKNLGGWKFKDISREAGVGASGMSSTGASFGDLDGDGDLDLFVSSCGGPNALFINDGKGKFSNQTKAAGLEAPKIGSTSVAMGDIDSDGDLDIYVTNYGETSVLRSGGKVTVRTVNGKEVVTGRYSNRIRIVKGNFVEVGEPDFLYLNDGSAKFVKVDWLDGNWLDEVGKPIKKEFWDLGLSVMIRDINQDGLPDIYNCNDFQTPDRLWINKGNGKFQLVNEMAIRHRSYFAMAVDFADINRDGNDDFFVADMISPKHLLEMTQIGVTNPFAKPIDESIDRPIIHRNTLYVNRGDNTYMETANYSGVAATEWTWGSTFMDVDLDGLEDLLIANGHAFDTQDLDTIERTSKLGSLPVSQSRKKIFLFPPLAVPNMIYRNIGSLQFNEVGKDWGFDSKNVSHGISLCDLDNDGDQDVVVSCLNANVLVYRNNTTAPRLSVVLRGANGNTRGIGARITVRGAAHVQSQEMIAGGRYLAGDQPLRTFAAGKADKLSIEVGWPRGTRTIIDGVKPNYAYEIHEKNTQTKQVAESNLELMFTDGSDQLNHVNAEAPSDDFYRQPMLPRRLSESGPGIVLFDWNGDGHEELFFGNGAGGNIIAYKNETDRGLVRLNEPAFEQPLLGDALGLAGWVDANGKRALIVAVSNHDFPEPVVPSLHLFRPGVAAPEIIELPSKNHSDIGSLAVADIDGDGDLDVFVAGRSVPGQFPKPASSWLLRCGPAGLELDKKQLPTFANIGMVTAAVFAQLDSDPFPELVLATEWGAIRIFKNNVGTFTDITKAWGLDQKLGLWQTLAIGDFDNDGRLDIMAGNWGLNSHLKHGKERVPYLVHGDIGGDGFYDAIEARFDIASRRLLPRHRMVTLDLIFPFLRERFPTHRRYGGATIQQIFSGQLANAKLLKVTDLESVILLNRGGKFETRPLPVEAQLTPVMGAAVADFDGDGNEDLFLSQNYFAVRVEDYRMDAGEGLLLRGNGQGAFTTKFGYQSGIKVFGEQRGCVIGDLNRDGRPDLLVAQSKARPKLYFNSTGKAGLKLSLNGSVSNPNGQGASVRAIFDNGSKGPARLVGGSSGRYSQGGTSQILGGAKSISALEVSWPRGKRTRVKVTDTTKPLVLSND
ncbi:MAG: VCBS repeat-containing protein [Verrucomicrobiota bacterium]|nr:VCBS repeat-containing protein [Verrucomicrobiota bacterium]